MAEAVGEYTVTDADLDGFEVVTLDGSGSTDPDGTIVQWFWDRIDFDVDVRLGTGETLDERFEQGSFEVRLTVVDDGGAQDTDVVMVEVTRPLPQLAGVFIFEETHFEGNGKLLLGDVSDLRNLPGPCGVGGTWDNCISSMIVSQGWTATLFDSAEFEGEGFSYIFPEAVLLDIASSIQVRPPERPDPN